MNSFSCGVVCCVLLFGGRTKLFSRLFHFFPFFVRVIKKTVPINNPCPRNLIEFIRFLVLDGLTLIYECLASWHPGSWKTVVIIYDVVLVNGGGYVVDILVEKARI